MSSLQKEKTKLSLQSKEGKRGKLINNNKIMNKLKLSNDDIRKELEDPTLTDKQRSIILDYLLYKERQKERALKAVEARQAKYTNEQWKKLMSDRAKKVWKKRKLLKK